MRRTDVDVKLGMDVYAQNDAHVGKVDRIIVARSGGAVQSLVIHKGFFFSRDVFVPLEHVRSVEDDGVHLSLTKAQLDQLPEFREEEVAPFPISTIVPTYTMGGVMYPLDTEPGVAPTIVDEVKDLPPGTEDIARGYTVLCADGPEAGVVRDVAVDSERGAVDYLLVEGAVELPDGREEDLGILRIPATAIAGVADEVVTLTIPFAELRSFARSDQH
jgi:uncharacterized protein YrrD